MARIEESVEIKQPVERVFAFVTDANSWPKWETAMVEVEQTSKGEMGVGSTYRGTNRIMGQRMAWTLKVTECEKNRSVVQEITIGSSHIKEYLTFDSVNGSTKFTLAYDAKMGGFLKLLMPMVVSSTRKQAKDNLGNLKRLLEE